MSDKCLDDGPAKNAPATEKHGKADEEALKEEENVKKEAKVVVEYPTCLQKVSRKIIGCLEGVFYRLGLTVASHPYTTIAVCLFVCGICGIGLNKFKQTKDDAKLWVPKSARVLPEKKWVNENFPEETRFVSYIVTAPNVLAPSVLHEMYDMYKKAQEFGGLGRDLGSLCVKIGHHCLVHSILELWNFNETIIKRLSFKDVLTVVQSNVTYSPMYGTEFNIEYILGGIRYDEKGRIHGAESVTMLWVTEKRAETDKAAMAWEKYMIDSANTPRPYLYRTFVYATRSDIANGNAIEILRALPTMCGSVYAITILGQKFDDEGYGAVNADVSLLTAGFIIVFVFIIVVLGRFNLVEHKLYVSLAGILCIGLAILFSYGIALSFGFIYGPIHSLMPFLLLGIGVDDMFVIIESWRNLKPAEKQLPLEEKIALSLRHAGVSITVTSITDIVAFGIGGSTVIPALKAFCVYAALGILGLYLLVSTFFVAVVTLDNRRIEQNRDGVLCCVIYRNYQPNSCSQKNIVATIIDKIYAPVLMKVGCKVIVILITLVVAGVNMWSFSMLRQDFDLYAYLPSDSYATDYIEAQKRLYTNRGYDATIYCDNMDYYENRDQLQLMATEVNKNPYIESGSPKYWFLAFENYLKTTNSTTVIYQLGPSRQIHSSQVYYQMLLYFLRQREGMFYGKYIKFTDTMPYRIKASYIPFYHVRQPNSAGDIKAMESIRDLLDHVSFKRGHCFSYGFKYINNETNMVLVEELYRNLALAALCVFVVTLVLIANLWTSIIVFTCVVFTVVDVVGTLQFWGTSVDTASSILIILCVGLAVDYSAHVGHTFMTIPGKKEERAKKTLFTIGPAVLNGGFSTFLAFVLLADSRSLGFVMFFRVFMTVVLFGLFHGLVYLPVVLSLIGPPPYDSAITNESSSPEALEMLPQNKEPQTNGDINISQIRCNCSSYRTNIRHCCMNSHLPSLKVPLRQSCDSEYRKQYSFSDQDSCHDNPSASLLGNIEISGHLEQSHDTGQGEGPSTSYHGDSGLGPQGRCSCIQCDKQCSICMLYRAQAEIQRILTDLRLDLDFDPGEQNGTKYCVCHQHIQTSCT